MSLLEEVILERQAKRIEMESRVNVLFARTRNAPDDFSRVAHAVCSWIRDGHCELGGVLASLEKGKTR